MVLRIFRGESLELLSRALGVELYRLGKWRDAALAGMEEGLKARNGGARGGNKLGSSGFRVLFDK